jgi:16S rRNA U516 pseudouridylate synthase RsuA-like enzyme
MFEAVGHPVISLKRLSIGGLALDASLGPGQYRLLFQDELALLRRAARMEL